MKNQKGFVQVSLLVTIVVGVLVLGGAGYFGVRQYNNYRIEKAVKDKEAEITAEIQRRALEQAQTEIEELRQESEAAKTKQMQLEQIVESTRSIQQNNLASIIKIWRPRIAYIECIWGYGGALAKASGSGLLEQGAVITNDHVFRLNGKISPRACAITFPDRDSIYSAAVNSSVAYGGGVDLALISLSDKDSYVNDLSAIKVNYCKQRAEIGDAIVILGYPFVGSKNDITATEGIVSGYDGYYYVTSAKIEQGNSGGVAILLKDNCYLGIPSSVAAGKLESFGRILDAGIVYDGQYFEKHPNGL